MQVFRKDCWSIRCVDGSATWSIRTARPDEIHRQMKLRHGVATTAAAAAGLSDDAGATSVDVCGNVTDGQTDSCQCAL